MRTEEAVTGAERDLVHASAVVLVLYAALGTATVLVLRGDVAPLARRAEGDEVRRARTGRGRAPELPRAPH